MDSTGSGSEFPRTSVSGMPRIGPRRELKRALEAYWSGRVGAGELAEAGSSVRRANWEAMARHHIDLIPSNDFSLYDQVLDAAVLVGAVPPRYLPAAGAAGLDSYFAMARGGMIAGNQLEPLQLTK
ncbi:MAG: 5-methyltetrahydropteroyltriglutamate--homocysteine S-methyltransferase, partial [Candidatus Dormibacteria bacterium]